MAEVYYSERLRVPKHVLFQTDVLYVPSENFDDKCGSEIGGAQKPFRTLLKTENQFTRILEIHSASFQKFLLSLMAESFFLIPFFRLIIISEIRCFLSVLLSFPNSCERVSPKGSFSDVVAQKSPCTRKLHCAFVYLAFFVCLTT